MGRVEPHRGGHDDAALFVQRLCGDDLDPSTCRDHLAPQVSWREIFPDGNDDLSDGAGARFVVVPGDFARVEVVVDRVGTLFAVQDP